MKVGRERSSNQVTLELSSNEDVKPTRKKRLVLNGRTFKALVKTQLSQKAAADKNGINSSEKDAIAKKETLANAQKLLAACSREKQLPAHEVASADLIGRSHDNDIDVECGNSAALSKRKRDLVTDLDASALDAKKDYCTSASNELHLSSGCRTHNVFETCDVCSKKQRVDLDAHGPNFCSCSSVLAKSLPQTNIHEDNGQVEASSPTEYAEKLDNGDQLKEARLEIQTEATESHCIICKRGGRLMFCDGKYCNTSFHPSCLDPSCSDSIAIDVPEAESSDMLGKIRERLSQYIPCECKSSSSKFIEFWVPCVISNVQLEQYCNTLLSNSVLLCLHSKNDRVGALRDAVFSTRKSCDHPYIVDSSLKPLITKDLSPFNYLDVEIKASGKLQLLEMILSEIKRRQLRVLILFQSVAGSRRDTLGLGDVLDDFLRERFGIGTYERLDGGAITSKSRQRALNNFNKESKRFVFLLENRACLPSIKLLSVDAIILFDSDWNPGNDVKALNKISIESQFKRIKIFRLYSVFTVEEQVLILAKQGLTFESNLENISRDASNTLLMWGASCLLSRLDEFHRTPDANVSSENTLLSKVVDGISILLSHTGECDDIDNSYILKVQHNGGIYKSAHKLLGEQEVQLSADEPPHIFWTNLLSQRNPNWKFISSHTQRHRKKVKYSDDSPEKAECEAVEVGKKRKKGGVNGDDSPRKPECEAVEVGKNHRMEGAIFINTMSINHGLEPDNAEGGESRILGSNGSCCLKRPDVIETNPLDTAEVPLVVSEKSMLPNAKKSLHLSVKPDILKLCEILKLSDEVKIMVEKFLVYVISNHEVVKSDSANILQAFLLSLCWSSASLLKQKIDRKECLLLARQHLKFSCNENEADSMYSAVQKLEKAFEENILSDLSKDGLSGVERFHRGTLNEKMMQLQNVNVKPDLEETGDQICTDEIAQAEETHKVDADNKLKLLQKKCRKRIAKLKKKQEDEIKELNRSWDVHIVEIENKQKVESAIIKEMYSHNKPVRMEKLRILDLECRKNIEELEREKEISIKELRERHLDVLSDESRKVAGWLKSAIAFATEASGQDEPPLHHSSVENEVGDSQADEHGSSNVSENVATLPRHADDVDTEIVGMVPDYACVTDPNQGVRCNSLNEIVTITENPNLKDDEVHVSSVNGFVAKSQQPKGLGNSANVCESTGSISLYHSKNQNPDQIMCGELGNIFLTEPVRRIPEEIIGNASCSELRTPAAEFHEENDSIGGVSTSTQNVLINHCRSGEVNSSVGVDSPSAVMPENQPSSSPACNQVRPPALQLLDAEKDDQPNFNTAQTEDHAHDERSQLEHSMDSLLGHSPTNLPHTAGSAPKPLIERDTPPQCDEAVQLSENAAVLSGLAFSLIDQNVEENPEEDNQERHLAAETQPDIPQQIVEHTVELPNQALPSPGSNGERSSPTGVIETPLQHHQPNLPSTSTLDLKALNLDRSLINFEAVTQVNESTTEIPRQAVISNGVAISVQGLNNPQLCAQYHGPSQILELTSYIDPLQNELEGIRKGTEQAIKFYEDTEMRLKTELEENIAQIYREYEAKHKDAEAAFLRTKKELEENHNKVLMNKMLAGAFRSMETHRFLGMQQQDVPPGVSQHLNQSPLHSSPRPSSTDFPSSSGQHNTAPILQPTSRVYPSNVPSRSCQPAVSHQNITLQSKTGTRLSPFTASSSSQFASNQQRTTLPMQPDNFVNNFVSFSSSAGQSAANQQNVEQLLQPSPRIPPISVLSSAARPASSQQNTPPPLQIVHQASALFSNSPTRPPHINAITPLMGNLRVGNDNRGRSPAPHLQALRSSSSSNFTSPSMMPIHLPPSDRATSSSYQLPGKPT